jgi:hypothetical protein
VGVFEPLSVPFAQGRERSAPILDRNNPCIFHWDFERDNSSVAGVDRVRIRMGPRSTQRLGRVDDYRWVADRDRGDIRDGRGRMAPNPGRGIIVAGTVEPVLLAAAAASTVATVNGHRDVLQR